MECRNQSTRINGLDYLKTISIIMIILFHYIYNSGFDIDEFTGIQRIIIDIIYMFGEIGVDCFALSTGFLSAGKTNFETHYKKVVNLWLRVLFFSVIVSFLIYFWVDRFEINANKIIHVVMPISFGTWWYTSAYFVIFLIIPIISKALALLSKKEFRYLLTCLLGYFSVIATAFGFVSKNPEKIYGYNRFVFLLLMICVGEYWKLHVFTDEKQIIQSRVWKITLSVVWIFLLAYFIITERWPMLIDGFFDPRYFWPPNTVITVLISVSLFAIFVNSKFKQNKLVSLIAASTLGIYQIHGGISSALWWKRIFHTNVASGSWLFLAEMVVAILLIVICGVILDFIISHIVSFVTDRIYFLKS